MQIPQVMREFITRGAWAIQEWQPDHSLKLERSLKLAREARVADSETHAEEDKAWPGARQAGGPAVIFPLLLGTNQTMNQVAMCPVYPCCPSAIMRGACLTLGCGTAWTSWYMVTLLTCLLRVVSLVLSPHFPPSLPGDCFTRWAYDTICILIALLYKVIGKTFFFSHLESPNMVFRLVWLRCHPLLPFFFDVARSGGH